MIPIIKENAAINRLKSILFTLGNRLDNNNNADIDSNGEALFLHRLLGSYKGNITVFDIGANIGHYSEIIVDYCSTNNLNCELHLFEPTNSCFAELVNKFGKNNSVHLNNFGVSDEERASKIYYDKEQSGFASLYKRDLKHENISMDKSEDISLQRLDTYIESEGIEKIDLLKIDIEGHELVAFKGMGKYLSPDFITAIQFEYGGANLDSHTTLKDFYDVLESAGFEIYKIMKKGLEKRGYITRMENFQYSNFVALDKRILNK